MSQFLLYYQRPEPATWVYLSSFLTIGLYFVFHRFWSIRNLDIVLLILLGPGLLLVHEGRKRELAAIADTKSSILVSQVSPPASGGADTLVATPQDMANDIEETPNVSSNPAWLVEGAQVGGAGDQLDAADSLQAAKSRQLRGFIWLFVIEGAILLRLLFDPLMVRRPLLDPNLTTGGLVFIGAAMLIFLMANVITSTPEIQREQGPALGPGYPVLNMLPAIPTTPDAESMLRQRPGRESLQRFGLEESALLGQSHPNYGVVRLAEESVLVSQQTVSQQSSSVDDRKNTAGIDLDSMLAQAAEPRGREPDGVRDPDVDSASRTTEVQPAYAALARTLAIAAHLAVIIGMMMIGHHHFGNFKAGAGCATLYLLLPYTAQMTGRVDHVLPAALLVWAVLMYRRPLLAGICLGLAAGLVYYPAFLLPLWLGFYRQRGLGRFAGGVAGTMALLTILLSLGGSENFKERLIQMYGLWLPWIDNLEGVWGLGWQPIWRLPVLVAFVLLAGLYSFWPRQKNLGTLMSCSATLMVAAQFWHGFGGGLFVAWFLPLMLLTVFRPNLEDRVALKVIGGGPVRRVNANKMDVSAA